MSNLTLEIQAVVNGDIETVQRFVDQHQRDDLPTRLTQLLHVAVEWDQVDVAKVLIQARAD